MSKRIWILTKILCAHEKTNYTTFLRPLFNIEEGDGCIFIYNLSEEATRRDTAQHSDDIGSPICNITAQKVFFQKEFSKFLIVPEVLIIYEIQYCVCLQLQIQLK